MLCSLKKKKKMHILIVERVEIINFFCFVFVFLFFFLSRAENFLCLSFEQNSFSKKKKKMHWDGKIVGGISFGWNKKKYYYNEN